MEFDLSGHVRVSAQTEGPGEPIVAEMDPYRPLDVTAVGQTAGPPEVLLSHLAPGAPRLEELQLAAGDGLVTGSSGGELYVLAGRHRARVPDALAEGPSVVQFDAGFPVRRLFREVVRPVLQLQARAAGSVACHAAAVELDGAAVLIAGWSESGKTETALALAEAGGRFLTDKWTFLGDGMGGNGLLTAAPFPISVGVRRWVLRYLPRLRQALPARVRPRLTVAAAASAASRPVRGRWDTGGMLGRLSSGAERVVALADRVSLSPTEIAVAYGHQPLRERTPVGLVVVLRTVPDRRMDVEAGDVERLSRRLAASAVTERQTYTALRQRAAFATGSGVEARIGAEVEAERLRAMLDRVPVVEVSAPFPVDPRVVVDALGPWLSARS